MSTARGSDESFASLFEQSASAKAHQRRYRAGERVEVTIVAVGREAVFADLGGKQEGVFERIELSDPEGNLRVEVGSRVTAVVNNVDFSTGQVRLSPVVIRSADSDDVGVAHTASSGSSAGPMLVEGARVKGAVTGIERYGVFVQIAGTRGRSGRGLVPSAETGTPRGADLKKHFTVGQEIETKILSIDETGKIRLSVAALGADDERGVFEAFKQGKAEDGGEAGSSGKPAAKGEARKEKPTPRNFGTLADLLPKKLTAAEPKAPPAAKTPSKDPKSRTQGSAGAPRAPKRTKA